MRSLIIFNFHQALLRNKTNEGGMDEACNTRMWK